MIQQVVNAQEKVTLMDVKSNLFTVVRRLLKVNKNKKKGEKET